MVSPGSADRQSNVIVTVNTTSVQEGVVAGATTFTGVDQTSPLGTFVSADGATGGNSQLDVPSVINGLILDTLAVDGTQTVTIPGPQIQQWNVQSGEQHQSRRGRRGYHAVRSAKCPDFGVVQRNIQLVARSDIDQSHRRQTLGSLPV